MKKDLEEHNWRKLKINTTPVNLYDLQNVVKLDLSSNDIKNFPREICKLKNLRNLNLCDNKLSSLPQEFSKLKLIELKLIRNLFTDLPNEIQQMPLIKLSISLNNFTNITIKIKTLRELYCIDCELAQIPKFNKKLEILNLIGNNISIVSSTLARRKCEVVALADNLLNVPFTMYYTQFARDMLIYSNHSFTRAIVNGFLQPVGELM